MQQRLELKSLVPLIANNKARPKAPRRQRNAVHQPELEPPLLPPLLPQRLARQPKVKLHRLRRVPLARALPQELPLDVPREPVLGELAAGRGRAEDGEDEGDAAADGLGAVEGGGGGDEEVLARGGGGPGGDGRAVEEDGDGVARGEGGGYAGVVVGCLDLGGLRGGRSRVECCGAVGAVHCGGLFFYSLLSRFWRWGFGVLLVDLFGRWR